MISLPVKVLMFEGAEDSSPFTYYFYMENDEDLYLMQRKRNGSVVDKTKIPLTKSIFCGNKKMNSNMMLGN